MDYAIAEKFKSLQGEGVYTGTPMAFIRFVGCSVGKKICQHCDTIFERTLPWQGGGIMSDRQLASWAMPHEHVCLTGGEPFDQDLRPLLKELITPSYSMGEEPMVHIETSGTKILTDSIGPLSIYPRKKLWICVSPKPGYLEEMIEIADEVKVIVPGLGNGEGWPTLEDAVRWAGKGKIVFLQPRNGKLEIEQHNLRLVQDLLLEFPLLRLSVQMHKILKVQ